MIGVDTNILVYAHREDSPWHEAADLCLTELAESGRDWSIPWPCIHEFFAITTHPRIYDPPTPTEEAILQINCWMEVPTLHTIGEENGYWKTLRSLLSHGKIRGPQVHDTRIAAICLQHGVNELWTADRDFSRFEELKVNNPLLMSGAL